MASIHIVLNGDTVEQPAGQTVSGLLAELGRDPRTVAVEHNGVILKRNRYAEVSLSAGDQLEIVHFVQGGTRP